MFLRICLVFVIFWTSASSNCVRSYQTVICETIEDFKKHEQIGWDTVMIKSDDASKNTIETLSFSDFKRVQHLIVANKTIKRINTADNDYCLYETHLQSVSLFDNKLSAIALSINSLSSLNKIKLEKLEIINNHLETINPKAFDDYDGARIYSMDFSHNSLEYLQSKVFGLRSTTEILNLKNNKLSFLQANSLPSNLRILNLNNNRIIHLQDGAVSTLKKLQIVYLNYNKLLAVPNFSGSPDLEELELSHNQITAISKAHFANLQKLRVLDLSFNKLYSAVFLKNILIQKVQASHPTRFISLAFNHLTDFDFKLNTNGSLAANQLILFGNPWFCPEWQKIEQYFDKTKLNRSRCDLRYFSSGIFPYCIAPDNPLKDLSAWDQYEQLKNSFTDLVNKGKELNCKLELEIDWDKTLRLYRPTWRLCNTEDAPKYNY